MASPRPDRAGPSIPRAVPCRSAAARSIGCARPTRTVRGCSGIDRGFSRVATVTTTRVASDRQRGERDRAASAASGSSSEGQDMAAEQKRRPDRQGHRRRHALVGVLGKPAQASSKPRYMRQEARRSPGTRSVMIALAAEEPRELDAVVHDASGSRRGRRSRDRPRAPTSISWPQAAPKPGSRDCRMRAIGR